VLDEEIQVEGSVEALASQYGWSAEGEKSAEDFIKVAMDKFPDQSKKIKQLFRTVDEMKVHMSKTDKVAYDRAKAEFDVQRDQAIREGDLKKVHALEESQRALPEAMVQPDGDVDPAILEFEERNAGWLNGESYDDIKMQEWMQKRGALLGKRKLSTPDHMALLEEHVKKEFPDYFVDKDEKVVSPVASAHSDVSVKAGAKGKSYSFKDLSAEQKQIARDFEAVGIMKVEDYIKSLINHGEIK